MVKLLIGWMLKNQAGAKIGGLTVGGSGLIALIFSLHSDIKSEMLATDLQTRSYVDQQVKLVDNKIGNLEGGLKDIKTLLLRIDQRLYDLNKEKSK